jgi:cytosine deaminase
VHFALAGGGEFQARYTFRSRGGTMVDLLLHGGRAWGHEVPADILVRDGVIARIGPSIAAPGAEIVDITGRLVLPGLVDAHLHLDKTLYGGPWTPHSAEDNLDDRIRNERRRRHELGLPRTEYMTALLEQMVAAGTTHARSHTDVDPEVELGRVQAVRDAVSRLNGRISLTQVAFPQYGVLTNPGPPACSSKRCARAWTRSAASTRPGSTAIRSGISTSSSASRNATTR